MCVHFHCVNILFMLLLPSYHSLAHTHTHKHSRTHTYTHQMLLSVFSCGEMTETLSLAETAAQCMNTVCVSKESREFVHKGKFDDTVKESVSRNCRIYRESSN